MSEAQKNGLHRCPHCGSSDVALSAKEGELKCNYCRTVFKGKKVNPLGGVENLKGEVRGDGAGDIIPGEDIVLTFKCPSCGAEVVVNTDESLDASCHWCKHIFTVNEKVSNGAVPDLVLPFKISKAKAQEKARECMGTLSGVDSAYKKAFEKDGLRGVYFPFFIVDVNARMEMHGVGEKTSMAVNSGRLNTRASIESYEIDREFSVYIDDLTVESSSKRLNQDTFVNSNNIINAILPFDTENAVAWDANYLRGFASERRNTDIDSLKEVVALQSGDIARMKARSLIENYDRGVRWEREHLGIKGTRWKTAYLPVWLFSYRRDGDARIYYIAVNARTGETIGCAPNKRIGDVTGTPIIDPDVIERHHHEMETSASIANERCTDRLTATLPLSFSSEIRGRNDMRVIGSLSTGRYSMTDTEKARFRSGSNYTHAASLNQRYKSVPTHNHKAAKFFENLFILLLLFLFIVVPIIIALLTPGSGSGHSSSSSSSYYDNDYGSSWDSGGGFDYSYDY